MKVQAAYVRKLKKKEMDPSKPSNEQVYGVFSKKDKLMGRFSDQLSAEKHRKLVTMMGFIQRGSLDPEIEEALVDTVCELMLDGLDFDAAFDYAYEEVDKVATMFYPDDPAYWASDKKEKKDKKKKDKKAQFDPVPELLDMIDGEYYEYEDEGNEDVENSLADFFSSNPDFVEDLQTLLESRGEHLGQPETMSSIVGFIRERASNYFSALESEFEEMMLEKFEIVDVDAVAELITEKLM